MITNLDEPLEFNVKELPQVPEIRDALEKQRVAANLRDLRGPSERKRDRELDNGSNV